MLTIDLNNWSSRGHQLLIMEWPILFRVFLRDIHARLTQNGTTNSNLTRYHQFILSSHLMFT